MKPLTVEEIQQNSKIQVELNNQDLEVGENLERDRIEIGQFRKLPEKLAHTKQLNGIGRIIYTSGKYDT